MRAAGVGGAKKRLSTIPASPAADIGVKTKDEKENDLEPVPETSKRRNLVRPPLGPRLSTRSVAMQQRVREYELVNEMLQAAMAAEDAGDEVQEKSLTTAVDDAITHLKANIEVTGDASTAGKSTMLQESTKTISVLEAQLQESKATIDTLRWELEELRPPVAESDRYIKREGADTANAPEAITAAHAAEIEELQKKHQLEVSSWHQKVRELELSEQERAEHSLKALEDAKRAVTESEDINTAQLLEDEKSLHSKVVEALKNDLALEREAIRESANKVSLLEREIEEQKSNLAAATSEAGVYEKSIEACQDQLASRERELQGQGSVIKSLQDEIAALQLAKMAETEALKRSSEDKVAELQEQIAALKIASDRSSEESAASDAHAQQELVRQEKEISNLEQVIERLQDEVQDVHESKSTELDEKLLEIRQEHDQAIKVLKAEHQVSIDGLAKSHNNIVEKLGIEARNNRTAHERELQTLSDERSELRKSLETNTQLLKATRGDFETRMQEVETKHNEALQTANEQLQKAENALSDSQQLLQQTREDSEQTTATTVKMLKEEISALQGRSANDAAALRNARGDLEAAQKQAESLKQALEKTERDSQSKQEHHTEKMEKIIAEAEAVAKALSEKSESLISAEKDHARTVEEITFRHKVDLESVRSDLKQKHEHALNELKGKHDGLLAAYSNLEKSQNDEVEELKTEHERALADSSKIVTDLQHAHLGELEDVKRQRVEERSQALKQLEVEFSKRAADVEQTHNTALENLQSTHDKTLLDLRAELEASHLQRLGATRESYEANMKNLQAQLDQQKADLAKAQVEAQKASAPAENPELAKVRKDLQASADALTAAKSEASRLADEVEGMRQRMNQDQRTIDRLENAAKDSSKVQADASARELTALKEQLGGALQEAETQRANSDTMRKELRESAEKMKASQVRIEELEAKVQEGKDKPDSQPKTSTPGSTRRRNRGKGVKNSPRLSQSKWTSEEADGETAGSPSQRKEGENLGSSIQGTVGVMSQLLFLLILEFG